MYVLNLNESDLDTISFVGNRYGWSESIINLGKGDNHVRESDAWTIKDAIDSDMDGGHNAFPMLDPQSELFAKMYKFYNEIV